LHQNNEFAIKLQRAMTSTILLVDDNPIQAATRAAILSHSRRKVIVASDANQALALLQDVELAKSVRLVVTDHLMPKMNGPQFVATLREHFPNLSIIVLSGLPDAEREYGGMNVGFRLKPIAPDELIHLVQTVCRDPLDRIA
jgi:DNA-binding response OmpR family regulator